MIKKIVISMILVLLCGRVFANISHKEESFISLTVQVIDKSNRLGIVSSVVLLEPYKIWGITDDDGFAIIKNVPCDSTTQCSLKVELLGYKSITIPIIASQYEGKVIVIELEMESLAIDGAMVVAERSKSGESTASIIGRQAIDHLQATSIKDILQLIPGQVLSSNPNLTNASQFQIRTLQNSNVNNSFGASIMIDGIPVSNNAGMNVGSSISTKGGGVDLRSIGTDDIESVEIIRGIASAEYGDMSSGAMIINSKIGVSNLKFKAKVMPGIIQLFAGKGFKVGNGSINVSADYAKGKSDPRFATDIYHRAILSAVHSDYLFNGAWSITTKLSLKGIKEWSGADPDEPEALQQFFSQRNEYEINLSHSGKINFNKLFSRVLKYDFSYTNNHNDFYQHKLINEGRGLFASAITEGTFEGEAYPASYEIKDGVKSNPVTYYAKVSNSFYLNNEWFKNNMNIGLVFRSEGNDGIGSFDESDGLPATAESRLRRFCDIPYLNQLSGYVEDNLVLKLPKRDYPYIKAQIGVRLDAIQPFSTEQIVSVSPRINASIEVQKWLSLRLGYGISEKAPSLMYLYPELYYHDFLNLNVNDGLRDYYIYTSSIFDLTNKDLKLMRNTKYEGGFDLSLNNGMVFSIVGYYENMKNGFSYSNDEWMAISYDMGYPSSPTRIDTVLVNVSKPGNTSVHISKGIEFDFNLGEIKATRTSFYLNGAFSQTDYNSSNNYYKIPTGEPKTYSDVYLVFKEGAGSFRKLKQIASSLRIVQHIPAINFVVSATLQAVIYDYKQSLDISDRPIGYLKADDNWNGRRANVQFIPFTEQQLVDESYQFEGYMLKDQLYSTSVTNKPEIWPLVYNINLRVTKDINKYLGFSFFIINALYYQPWQTSNISSNPVERNGGLFSYGLEMYLNF